MTGFIPRGTVASSQDVTSGSTCTLCALVGDGNLDFLVKVLSVYCTVCLVFPLVTDNPSVGEML